MFLKREKSKKTIRRWKLQTSIWLCITVYNTLEKGCRREKLYIYKRE